MLYKPTCVVDRQLRYTLLPVHIFHLRHVREVHVAVSKFRHAKCGLFRHGFAGHVQPETQVTVYVSRVQYPNFLKDCFELCDVVSLIEFGQDVLLEVHIDEEEF